MAHEPDFNYPTGATVRQLKDNHAGSLIPQYSVCIGVNESFDIGRPALDSRLCGTLVIGIEKGRLLDSIMSVLASVYNPASILLHT